MTEINIEGVIFQIKQLFGAYCVFDSADSMVGRAENLPDAVAICEQIAWRRKVDGKVDEPQKVVDDAVYKTQPIIECELCKHSSIRLVIADHDSAFLKRVCALNVRYDGKSHCESFAMKENI